MKDLTLKEKLLLLVSEDNFTTYAIKGKVKKLSVSDGPCGLRKNGKPANCYPSPHVLANGWDRDAAYNVGRAIASDCIDAGEDVILAPGVNIKRTPLCGRNFEYFSEDPFLAGVLGAEYVKGVQDLGIGACVKHFCANNREHDRMHQTSEVDKRTLREIYTKAFEIIIKTADPYMVMGSYNPVNGINASENKWLMDGILRKELGYGGVLVSDWEAVRDRAKALAATLDISFPADKNAEIRLKQAYESGEITDEDIDKSVERVLALNERISKNASERKTLSERERQEYSLKAAQSGIVLLKNDGDVLPIRRGKVAFIGNDTHYVGGGSARVISKNEIRPLYAEVKDRLPKAETDNYRLFTHGSDAPDNPGIWVVDIPLAMQKAYDADVTVLTVGTDDVIETEMYDRTSLKLSPALEDIILKIASRANKLVVVLEAGSAVDMSGWIDKADAVVYSGFAGDQMNRAIADVLTGKVCPSGRLAETFPLTLEDTPTGDYLGDGYAERYAEGVFVGYRYYDSYGIPVLFPFGYGLSYAKFAYSDFNVVKKGEYEYCVSVDIKNISETDGAEVVQLYVRNIDKTVTRPEKELRRFDKIFLKAGEKKKVSFTTDKGCFAYFNVCYNAWHVDGGRYEILICRNVNETEFREKIKI